MRFPVLLKFKVLLIGDERVLLGMQTGPLTKKVSFKIGFKRVRDLVTSHLFLYIYYIETSLLLGCCPKLFLT